VRGYITAYDARDGRQLWRFFTVPDNPSDGFEGEHLRRAAEPGNVCHGDAAVAGALVPDLRYIATLENPDAWRSVVIDGALAATSMVSWRQVMNAEQADTIRHYRHPPCP
jgi:hypothetical protein